MIACASAGGVSGPKFMVPRQRRLTLRPERPRWMYSMLLAFHGGAISRVPVPGRDVAGDGTHGRGQEHRGPFGTMLLIFATMSTCNELWVPVSLTHSGGRPVRAVASSVTRA